MSDETEETTEGADAASAVATEEAPVEAAPEVVADSTEETGRENPRKVREGMVVSTSMDKTIVVEAVDRVRHRRYAKTVQRSNKLFAHDETNDANVGDRVRIQETRPMSKRKRWHLVEVIERAR